MNQSPDRLFDLLPLVYRMKDADQHDALRDLLRVIAEQVQVVEDDIGQLYENWFIETAEDWVVPYIAELIGYIPVAEAGRVDQVATARDLAREAVLVPRREVANTLRNRRRKGTLALLELLARDVAGWPARAVEFYRLLSWTQNVNHQWPYRARTADLRQGDALERLEGAFDEVARGVDVRRIDSHRTTGRYNIPSVGVFVWRLMSFSVTGTPAAQIEAEGRNCYTFSILGNSTPLFTRPQEQRESHPVASEVEVPTPIRRRMLEQPESAARDARVRASELYYGQGRSLAIYAPGWPTKNAVQPVPAERVIPADLSDWGAYRPPRDAVAVDPVLGRILFPARHVPPRGVLVDYQYGFSAPLGGGEHERSIASLPLRAISRFGLDQLADPEGLLAKLRAANPLATYLRERWSYQSAALGGFFEDPAAKPGPEVLEALVEALDAELDDPELYSSERFDIALPQELRDAIASGPTGLGLVRVNRELLEQAYKDDIAVSLFFSSAANTAELRTALGRWTEARPRHAVVELAASTVYEGPVEAALEPHQHLTIRAAQRKRPIIWLTDQRAGASDAMLVQLGLDNRVTVDGLMVVGRALRFESTSPDDGKSSDYEPASEYEGEVKAPPSVIGCDAPPRITIRHCTLVPGWTLRPDCEPRAPAEPSLELIDLGGSVVHVDHSITGSIQVDSSNTGIDPLTLFVSDSVVDATSSAREAVGSPGAGVAQAVLTALRATVFGRTEVHAVQLGEDSIFQGTMRVARRQIGCLRFCSIVPGSRTPRRYHCQPDLGEQAVAGKGDEAAERERQRLRPVFESVRYGTPTYCRLSCASAEEILRGAQDESEMGVFHDLYQPQRTANLLARLNEYTPAGMDVGITFAT